MAPKNTTKSKTPAEENTKSKSKSVAKLTEKPAVDQEEEEQAPVNDGKAIVVAEKKKRRHRSGAAAHIEAKKLMKSTKGTAAVKPIVRLMREIAAARIEKMTGKPCTKTISFQTGVPKAIARSVDKYLTERFKDAAFVASHSTPKGKRTIKINHYLMRHPNSRQ